MAMKRRQTAVGQAKKVTLAAVLAALSLIFLYAASFAPTGKMGLVALAGLFPAAAVVSFGFSAGFLCYIGTGLLGLILIVDKGMVLLYLLFFGLYPMIKGRIEQIRRLPEELFAKLMFFNVILTVFLTALGEVFFVVVPLKSKPELVVYLICNVIFFAYDYGFSKVIGFYRHRVDRVLRKI